MMVCIGYRNLAYLKIALLSIFSLHGEQHCKIKNDILVTVCGFKQDVITVQCYRQKIDQEKSRVCMLIAFILAGKQVIPNKEHLAS